MEALDRTLKKVGIELPMKLSVNLTVPVPVPEKIIISKERVSQFKGWFTR